MVRSDRDHWFQVSSAYITVARLRKTASHTMRLFIVAMVGLYACQSCQALLKIDDGPIGCQSECVQSHLSDRGDRRDEANGSALINKDVSDGLRTLPHKEVEGLHSLYVNAYILFGLVPCNELVRKTFGIHC